MGLSKKHFKIAEILAAFFINSPTEKNREEFEAWKKEKEKNQELAEHILDKENYTKFEDTASRFDRQTGWVAFQEHLILKSGESADKTPESMRLKSLPKNRFIHYLKYAAAVIILFASGLFYWLNRPVEQEKAPVFAYQIEAGTTGARLTMADGKVVDIEKDQTFLMKETDGTVIMTDSTGIGYITQDAQDEKEIRNSIQTLTGMEYTLTLSDGTKVYLNAESKIDFPASFKGSQRVVELSGEAYFDVAKDVEHPFIVKMRDLSVKVLGTSFNVRAYEDEKEITTTLAEGKVQVFDGQKFEDITPGEQVVYAKETKDMTVRQVDVSFYSAWREGRFVFRNERLEDIMAVLARWYDFEYQFMDEDVKNVRIGAKLNRYSNMNPIIDMLRINASMSVSLVDSVYYISSRK